MARIALDHVEKVRSQFLSLHGISDGYSGLSPPPAGAVSLAAGESGIRGSMGRPIGANESTSRCRGTLGQRERVSEAHYQCRSAQG